MRSALLLSSIDNPPRVIVITSSFPEEGKTTTALNLAIVLAQREERVLLVDADLRRGSLYRVFGIPNRALACQPCSRNRDRIWTCRLRCRNCRLCTFCHRSAAAQPRRNAFLQCVWRRQLRQWKQQFDRIVIDTAPLLAVSDRRPWPCAPMRWSSWCAPA